MGKATEMFSLLAVLAFAIWVLLASDPQVRLSRACAPVQWVGNVTLSATAFAYPAGESGVKNAVDNTDYACRYTLWRLFYGKQYDKWKKEHQAGDQGTSGSPSPHTRSTQQPKGSPKNAKPTQTPQPPASSPSAVTGH